MPQVNSKIKNTKLESKDYQRALEFTYSEDEAAVILAILCGAKCPQDLICAANTYADPLDALNYRILPGLFGKDWRSRVPFEWTEEDVLRREQEALICEAECEMEELQGTGGLFQ